MINLYSAEIQHLAIHQLGNAFRNEGLLFSNDFYQLNDETTGLFKEFFLRPFREKEEDYLRFCHESDLDFNTLYALVSKAFAQTTSFLKTSKKIAQWLYEQSTHPHIKSGEVYVCYLNNIVLDHKKVDAIGVFKSELKHDFLQFDPFPQSPNILQGVHMQKLDKGCLIFNTEKEAGYRLMSVDSNRYDTKYWLDNFLGVCESLDENFYTKNYLKFCQNFAKDVVLPAEDKQQEVLFMNRTVNHFAKNDAFEETNFLNEVIENPELIPEFKHYKVEKGPKYSIEDVSSFDIANKAVTEARKKIKNVISLDTNIQIKMDFINPEAAKKYVEKGWDEERQMYYYLVYFNKEIK